MTHVEELLSVWRDAERLLDTLPPMSPDHEAVRDAVVEVRAAYQAITGGQPVTDEALATATARVRDAERLIGELRSKHRVLEGIAEAQAEPA
jgi:hypothetical protein